MPVSLMIVLLICLIVMAWSFYRQVKGKDVSRLAEPFCSKCRADLREGWDDSLHCHQCGQTLEEPFNIYFGKKAKPITPKKIVLRILSVIAIYYLVFGGWHLIVHLRTDGLTAIHFNMMQVMPFIVLPFATLLGAALTIRNGNGLPRVTHPYCSQCEYDLRVNWRDVTHCPECGQDLARHDAVYFGRSHIRTSPNNMQRIATIVAIVMFSTVLVLNLYQYVKRKFRPAVAPVPALVAPINTPANSTVTPSTPATDNPTR